MEIRSKLVELSFRRLSEAFRTTLFLTLATMLWASPSLGQGYSFLSFDVPGAMATRANGINSPGQIVGRYIDSSGDHHGFLRGADGSTITTIDPPFTGISKINARSINAGGEIVGSYLDSGGTSHGFFRSTTGVYRVIDVPASFGAAGTNAQGINNIGQVVGYYTVSTTITIGTTTITLDVPHGFLRSADGTTFTKIDFPGALITVASGINDAGEIAGGYAFTPTSGTTLVPHAFTLNWGTYSTFDFPASAGTFAHSINEPFAVVGSYSTSPFSITDLDGDPNGLSGFLKNAKGTTFTAIDFPASGVLGTQARGVNAAGVVVGDYADSADIDHAFVASP